MVQSDPGWSLLLGGLLGAGTVLLGVTLLFSRRFWYRARSQANSPLAQQPQESLTASDRHEILALLHQWMRWAGEYSAVVSRHHNRLVSLAEELQRDSETTPSERRLASLLEEIIQSNQQLQQRLESAEQQLDHQSRQIQSYLTEARTDGLTQLFNRRSFDQKLHELLTTYRNGGERFVLAMIDIDQFKHINDTLGHQAGDAVLQQVAGQLKQQFENAHLIARYGGEEFALLLPGTLEAAAERADEFRRQLANRPIAAATQPLRVTLSCGLSEPAAPAESVQSDSVQLIRRADEALYAAKRAGRDRVYYHDGQQCVPWRRSDLAEPNPSPPPQPASR